MLSILGYSKRHNDCQIAIAVCKYNKEQASTKNVQSDKVSHSSKIVEAQRLQAEQEKPTDPPHEMEEERVANPVSQNAQHIRVGVIPAVQSSATQVPANEAMELLRLQIDSAERLKRLDNENAKQLKRMEINRYELTLPIRLQEAQVEKAKAEALKAQAESAAIIARQEAIKAQADSAASIARNELEKLKFDPNVLIARYEQEKAVAEARKTLKPGLNSLKTQSTFNTNALPTSTKRKFTTPSYSGDSDHLRRGQ